MSVARSALLAFALGGLVAPSAAAAPVIGPPTQDANGVLHYPVTSSYQASGPNELRVLLPQSPGTGQRRFLYALPVEPGTQSSYGDPIDTLSALGVLDTAHLILVVPAFSLTPWYADHPTDPTIRQESYLVDDLVPAVEALYPETPANLGPPRRLLVGFSKSGMGALSLILRHSALFDAAAMWDAPLDQSALSGLPGMTAVFGTEANYDVYAIPNALPLHAAEFTGSARLWLGGYSSQAAWRNDMTAAHDAMTSLGMTHVWVDGPQRLHRWDSGWVEEAVVFLDQAAPAQVFASDAGPADDAGDASTSDASTSDASTSDASTSDASTDAPPAADSGSGGTAGSGGKATAAPSEDGGCGCNAVGGASGSSDLAFAALAGVLALRRRRAPVRGWRRRDHRGGAPSARV